MNIVFDMKTHSEQYCHNIRKVGLVLKVWLMDCKIFKYEYSIEMKSKISQNIRLFNLCDITTPVLETFFYFHFMKHKIKLPARRGLLG